MACQFTKSCRGCPAASYFSCFAKQSNQKKATPSPPPLRGSLRCSSNRAAAELALCAQTVLADFPRLACATRRWKRGISNAGFASIRLALCARSWFFKSRLWRFDLADKLGRRRALFELRSRPRFVRPARASCAYDLSFALADRKSESPCGTAAQFTC
jgi:hypothetical protein